MHSNGVAFQFYFVWLENKAFNLQIMNVKFGKDTGLH